MMIDTSLAERAIALWNYVQPDSVGKRDLLVTFYQVDKGWWRLMVNPATFYDFYATGKNVGEGPKSLRDPGVPSSRATVVPGLQDAADLHTAFDLCVATVESQPRATSWAFYHEPQEWRRYWNARETNLAANVTLDGRWRAFRPDSDKFEENTQPGDAEAAKGVVDAVLRRFV